MMIISDWCIEKYKRHSNRYIALCCRVSMKDVSENCWLRENILTNPYSDNALLQEQLKLTY